MYKVRPSKLATQNNKMGDSDLAGCFISRHIARKKLVEAEKFLNSELSNLLWINMWEFYQL